VGSRIDHEPSAVVSVLRVPLVWTNASQTSHELNSLLQPWFTYSIHFFFSHGLLPVTTTFRRSTLGLFAAPHHFGSTRPPPETKLCGCVDGARCIFFGGRGVDGL